MDSQKLKKSNLKLSIRFLKEQGIFGKFVHNVLESKTTIDTLLLIRRHELSNTVNLIDMSFTWATTNEGSDFWCRKYEKLEKLKRIYARRQKNRNSEVTTF